MGDLTTLGEAFSKARTSYTVDKMKTGKDQGRTLHGLFIVFTGLAGSRA